MHDFNFKTVALAVCAASLICHATWAADASNADDWIKANMPALVELYKHLHQTPELSGKEQETSARMAKELEAIGADVTSNIGGYGVVGVLKNGPGKVLLLRS